jgi:DNA-binding transcriptional LysR family regulator
MRFTLKQLEYFLAAAEAGSITIASARARISQPSISAAIAQIEATLGTSLFVRHHARGMTPTAAGQRFVNDARHLLNHARDFSRSAESLTSDVSGQITVGSFVTLAIRFMPGLLAEFARRVPGITVNLEEGNQQDIIEGITSGRLELAMAYAYAVPEEVVAERLAVLPPYILVASDHPLAGRDRISLKEIGQEPFILLDLPFSRDYFFNLFMTCGVEPRIAHRSRSPELIRGLVGHGCGYTIHNALPGTNVSYDGRGIVAVPIAEHLASVHMVSLRLRRQNMRPAVRIFADFMKDAFRPGGLFPFSPH